MTINNIFDFEVVGLYTILCLNNIMRVYGLKKITVTIYIYTLRYIRLF